MARRKSSKPRSTKSTRNSKSRKGPTGPAPTLRAFMAGISAERRMDILGVGLALIGGLTLLAVISGAPGGIGAFWLNLLQAAFGWGVYLFPLALLIFGLWLTLRHFERVPELGAARILGALLLFVNVLVWLHVLLFAEDETAARVLAAAGMGGGGLGGGLMAWLQAGLGVGGMLVVLAAWALVALSLTLDVSVVALFAWAQPLWTQIEDARRARRARRFSQTAPSFEHPPEGDRETVPEPPANFEGVEMGLAAEAATLEPEAEAAKPVWVLPKLEDMLDPGSEVSYDAEENRKRATTIEETLASFGAPATVVEINRGPTITQFGVEPDFVETRNGRTRVRVGKIAALADDLALSLAASRIRVQAPVPGKGFVGIEVPNEQLGMVALRDVIESDAFKRMRSPLRFALGEDVAGNAVAADLAAMPHLLIAGATGSGKSVSVNAFICCLLLNNTPETLRLIMIDPKRVELTGYNGVPHLLTPVVVEIERVVGILQWITHEMDKRYQHFALAGARNISDFNAGQLQASERLPYLVVVIDELADLMMVAPDQSEKLITRMAQLARATGIHLVISTQRPSVDVVTGLIKANFPARISFAVASGTDSRVILDQPGAERLLGRGDMLFQPPDAPAPVRLQGVYLSENEIMRIVQYWRAFAGSAEQARVAGVSTPDAAPVGVPLKQMPIWDEIEEMQEKAGQDELFDEAVDLVRRRGRASISMLQRRMRIGYTRSARIVEEMEARGIIGPPVTGAQHREVLDYGESAAPPVGE